MHEARLVAAAGVREALAVDALLVLGITNIRFFTGFTGSDGVLLLADGDPELLCDGRYTLQAGMEARTCKVTEYQVKTEGIVAQISKAGCRRVAFDAEKVTVAFFNTLAAALPAVEFVPLTDELDQLRAVKSPPEIAAVAAAAELASAAFTAILPLIRVGVSERFLAFELEMAMRKAGADAKAFDFIVAAGKRGALPHARPTDNLLKSGELVTFDFGACCGGYHSDETVTVAVNKPGRRLLDIYRVAKEAHTLALEAVRPGIECCAVDAIARKHIENAAFGRYFSHGLGHGVGLEVHEKPTVSARSQQQLQEGMIITVEPGIYIPGLGGVRIEDLVVVTADGCRVLSKVSKTLTIC